MTCGPTVTSRPRRVSKLNQTLAGSTKVAPSAIARSRSRPCSRASAVASSARLLMPMSSSAGASTAAQSEPAPAGQCDDIGQVIFALGIVIADLGQELPEQRAIHRHDAGIAEADPPLRRRGVAMLDDRLQPALAVGDQPAVFPGIGGPHPQHHRRRTVGGAAPGQEALEGRGRDEGGIAIEDENVARRLVARCPRLAERLFGREHRMAGAELLRLDGARMGRHRLADRFHAGCHHDDHRRCAQRGQARQHMADHRPAGDGMQHLRQIGLHPRALAGGKDDGGGGGIWP